MDFKDPIAFYNGFKGEIVSFVNETEHENLIEEIVYERLIIPFIKTSKMITHIFLPSQDTAVHEKLQELDKTRIVYHTKETYADDFSHTLVVAHKGCGYSTADAAYVWESVVFRFDNDVDSVKFYLQQKDEMLVMKTSGLKPGVTFNEDLEEFYDRRCRTTKNPGSWQDG